MPDALGEFEGFESMHAGRPPVGVALIGRSGMRQMRGEEMSDYLPSTEEVLDPYIWLMGRECAADREKAAQAWLAAYDREVAAKALREFMEQLQTSESVLALKLDDILNGIDWMDSGDEVARWIISAITATGEIRATQIEKGQEG